MLQIIATNSSLHSPAVNILVVVAYQIGELFMAYLPMIRCVIDLNYYPVLLRVLQSTEHNMELPESVSIHVLPRPTPLPPLRKTRSPGMTRSTILQEFTFLPETTFSEYEWIEWKEAVLTQLLLRSASPGINVSGQLADRYPIYKEAVFSIAIAQFALDSPTVPIVQTVFSARALPKPVLSLFMDALQILEFLGADSRVPDKIVCAHAISLKLYHQALRAAERLFEAKAPITADLIKINLALDLPLAAAGVFRAAHEQKMVSNSVEFHELLGNWETTLEAYTAQLQRDPQNESLLQKRFECLRSLSRYTELANESTKNVKYQAIARWHLKEFQKFVNAAVYLNQSDPDTLIYRILWNIVVHDFAAAERLVGELRQCVIEKHDAREFQKATFGYDLEEVLECLKVNLKLLSADITEAPKLQAQQDNLIESWKQRFARLPDDAELLFDHLCVESILLAGRALQHQWQRLFDIAIVHKKIPLAEAAMRFVTDFDKVGLALLEARIEYAKGTSARAFQLLSEFKDSPAVYLQIGKWYLAASQLQKAQHSFRMALQKDVECAGAWKGWGEVSFLTNSHGLSIEAFLNGLYLSLDNSETYTIRVLYLLFAKGSPEVYSKFESKIPGIQSGVWLDLLQYICAKMKSENDPPRKIVQDLLNQIGTSHPQALLYALLVPLTSGDEVQERNARSVLERLSRVHPIRATAIEMFANEVIRVSSSHWETWTKQLGRTRVAYFEHKNATKMLRLLQPLGVLLQKPPETFVDISFFREFGEPATNALDFVTMFEKSHDPLVLHAAWKLFDDIVEKMKLRIQAMTRVKLAYFSPWLSDLLDSEVIVPGSYIANAPLVRIQGLRKEIDLINTRYPVRKLGIIGSDGAVYDFLLTSRADRRLDHRFIHLFSLVNKWIRCSGTKMKERMNLVTPKVIPLTPEVGLTSWIDDCPTLYQVVGDDRKKGNVPVDLELKVVAKGGQSPVRLFEAALAASKGKELQDELLNGAVDSEDWLDRRLNYTVSLALTSVVGWLIGLGHRDPHHLLVQRQSARLIHVGLRHCFDVALWQKAAPETVPFRLTRMLVNALEVSRIEGTFRTSAEDIMAILRANQIEIGQLLDVFVDDPLYKWAERADGNPAVAAEKDFMVARIKEKLAAPHSVTDHLANLIADARAPARLAAMARGWMPWW
jgi:FKBP12-rapamycin complex-associated protein